MHCHYSYNCNANAFIEAKQFSKVSRLNTWVGCCARIGNGMSVVFRPPLWSALNAPLGSGHARLNLPRRVDRILKRTVDTSSHFEMSNERAIFGRLVSHPAAETGFLRYGCDENDLLFAGFGGGLGWVDLVNNAWLAPRGRVDTARRKRDELERIDEAGNGDGGYGGWGE